MQTYKIKSVKDGVITIEDIPEISYFEIVEIKKEDKIFKALVLDVLETEVKAILLEGLTQIEAGDEVVTTGTQPVINVSDNILGKVIDVFGNRLDKQEDLDISGKDMLIEKVAPSVIERVDVYRPLQTGILAIDALVPVGKGQRQLILGDRQTGKTSIAIDTIINLKDTDTICVYVAIGQKKSKVAQIVRKLKEEDAFKNTMVVSASASDPASQQYLAPYVGTAIAEFFAEQGKDALVVYDDLSKHANAYRQISLLLERPSGREAYPGDVFYLHSKLLERSVQYSPEKGNGSITSLPIIETLAGDLSAYIPTNVISITDGQIFMEKDLFNAGQRPAISIGASVSRVGGAAQTKAIKSVAGTLKGDLAQYRELAAFSQFGSDLDDLTKLKLKRGKISTELLKQNIYSPYSVEAMAVILEAANSGMLDELEISKLKVFTSRASQRAGELKKFDSSKKVEGEIKEEIRNLIKDILETLNV